jgi:excisionase family DNA binding protein
VHVLKIGGEMRQGLRDPSHNSERQLPNVPGAVGGIVNDQSTEIAQAESFLTVPDVANRLRMSERTVWRWISARLLKVKRFGRSVRIAERDLAELINRS